jgi:hypothetical protein
MSDRVMVMLGFAAIALIAELGRDFIGGRDDAATAVGLAMLLGAAVIVIAALRSPDPRPKPPTRRPPD